MTATIFILGKKATITDYEWRADNPAVANLLNSLLDPAGPSGADPNPDLTTAQEIAIRFNGEVLDFEPVKSETGIVY